MPPAAIRYRPSSGHRSWRERMLDAALRAMATVPGERVPVSPAASRLSARAGQPEQIASLPSYDAWPGGETLPWPDRGSRAEPYDVADASGGPDGHGIKLILDHMSWPGQGIAEQQLTEEPGAQKELLMLFQPGTPLVLTYIPAAFPDGRSLVSELEPVTGTADLLLTIGIRSKR